MAVLDVYNRNPLQFERGDGCWLYGTDGRAYLDFYSGIAVNSLGHNHPAIIETIKRQSQRFIHLSNVFTIAEQEELAHRLVKHSFAERAFMSNSGAEAIECALKATRRYHYSKGEPERYKIITFKNSFHGRTMAAVSASMQEKMCEGFSPLLPGFISAKVNDIPSVESVFTSDCAAVLIEPIQGEGGIVSVTADFMHFLRKLCDDNDMLLIFDEIQCGIGRTGSLFHYENIGVEPDIMALAKGLGGGLPIGATLMRQNIATAMTKGSHGSTFGGNPLCCAVANSILDVILAEDFLPRLRQNALFAKESLTNLVELNSDILSDARGEGLMLGLSCKIDANLVRSEFFKQGLLTIGAKNNVIRLLPALIISKEEIEQATDKISQSLATLRDLKKAM